MSDDFNVDMFLASLEDDSTPEMLEHTNNLNELAKSIASMSEALSEADEFKSSTDKNIKALIAQAQQLQQELKDHEVKVYDQRKALRELERKREAEERALQIAMQQKTLAEELAAMQSKFDLITAGAAWREFAKDHQISGAKIMATGKRVILADKMGLGKTLTVAAACDMVQSKKILYITTNDLMSGAENEFKRWAKHRTPMIIGGLNKIQRRLIIDLAKEMDQCVVFMNYEMWRKDTAFLQELVDVKFDTMIIDEAHNVKNLKSIAWRGIYYMMFTRNLFGEDVRDEPFGYCSVKYVFPMTGTPILNRPQDLYPMLVMTMPEMFGPDSINSFLSSYCERDVYTSKWKFGYGGMDRLVRRMQGKFVMRDRRAAGVILPPQSEIVYNLVLDPEEYPNQYRVAQQLNKYAQIVLDEERKANILYIIALITRKRQAMTWPAGIDLKDIEGKSLFKVDVYESIKIDKCIRHLSDENEWEGFIPDFTNDGERGPDGRWTGERVVIFSQFKEALKEIERRCIDLGICVVRYDGDTDNATKDEVKLDFDRFEIEHNGRIPRWQVCLANYKTGGVGLNFTDVTQTIILDEEWSPGKRDQAYARTDRIGQTQETTVHVLRVANSIEDWMASLIAEKSEMIDGFEGTVDLYSSLKKRIQDGDMI